MTILSRFSEKEREYFQYQARQDYLRQQRTIELEMERQYIMLMQKDKEILETNQRTELINQETQKLLAEIKQLKASFGTDMK